MVFDILNSKHLFAKKKINRPLVPSNINLVKKIYAEAKEYISGLKGSTLNKHTTH